MSSPFLLSGNNVNCQPQRRQNCLLTRDDDAREARQMRYSRSVIELNARLGLPPLTAVVCHSYACGCLCPDCRERERLSREGRPIPVVQYPWEAEAA